ncbi:MAG TPA: AMP-binding protein, partial [Kofleriaceae bacterium]|nr:AMP-binding protein [Kofleriaceae bacterium]
MLDALRTKWSHAMLYARALRSTGSIGLARPAQLAEFLRAAVKVQPGPHLAVMYQAAIHADREALVEYGETGVRRMTWGELAATTTRLTNALHARGIASGGRVALMLPNGAECLIAQQALGLLGATAVQIGYRLKAGEIAHILTNAEPGATLVHADYLAEMTAARAQAGRSGPMIVVDEPRSATRTAGAPEIAAWDRALAAASPHELPRARGGDGGGVIVYTSGTTGKSKGAHRNLRHTGLESVADMVLQVGLRGDDRHLVVCPLYHSMAPAFVAILLALGATIVLMNHFDPAGALDIIARERITSTLMVPTMLVRITSLPSEVLARSDASSLRWVMSGAAPLSTETARRFMDRFGPVLWNFYGSTETGMVTLAGPDDHVARPGTIGRALCGNEIRLLDDAGHEVATGEVGELYARNSMLITGYHRTAEATAASPRAGLFSVGDLARRDADGYYYLESRKHDLVISGGVNIYPREIEDHLCAHP